MGACGSTQGPIIDLDLQAREPAETEDKIYNDFKLVIEQMDDVYAKIEAYEGCQDLARKAMTTPSYENEMGAFTGLLSAVDSIDVFFQYAKTLEKNFSLLLNALASHVQDLESHQGLCLQLAQVFDFVLRFDATRMMRPNLSNDFSYYRRLLPKFNKHPDIKIKDDDASGMGLFTAEHIPMNACVTKAAQSAIESNPAVGQVLSIVAMSCANMLRNKKYDDEATKLMCARAMTGCLVLFDNVDSGLGAFHKRSPINVKSCVTVLKREIPAKDNLGMLNAIHFSTKNFNDAPNGVQSLFE